MSTQSTQHSVGRATAVRPRVLGVAARLFRAASAWPVRVLRRRREQEELHRYLLHASRSERADLQAIGVQLPPPRPDVNTLLEQLWR